MSPGPLFTVIIPTRDRPELLHRAVSSVLAQTVADLECLIVDDGGGTGLALPADARIRVLRTGGGEGASVARNLGISGARGRLLGFLDDDDEITPDRLALGITGLAGATIALCWRSSIPGNGRPDWCRRVVGSADSLLAGPIPSLGQTVLARDLTPLFDPRFEVSEDVEWWVRASAVGTIMTIPRVGYLVRNHPGPRQTSRLRERLKARQLLLETHAEFFAARPKLAAYQWKRLGGMAKRAGERQLARRAFTFSFKLDPKVSTALRLVST